MPELPEVETYRKIAETTLGRAIAKVVADDTWYLKNATTSSALKSTLTGEAFTGARRIGKLMLLDTTNEQALGLRFGMSGRLFVDDDTIVDKFAYAPNRAREKWDRFRVEFEDGGWMSINDARRLGGVELNPDEDRLGYDALTLTVTQLRSVLGSSRVALKARLMQQDHIAGVGNLIADETLWRAGLDPARAANELSDDEVKQLHRVLRSTVALLIKRGGSHTGDLMVSRVRDGHCPKDGAPLLRRTIGGRTSYSCSQHQR